MYLIEKREYRYEDKWDWNDDKKFISREDGSLIGYDTIDQAVAACRSINGEYDDDWDITEFPTAPVINEWYTIAEWYSFTHYLRIVEVR